MVSQILAIAGNTFLESVRQPIYFVLLMAGWIMQALNTALSTYSLGYTDSAEVSADNKLLLDMGLATVFGATTLLAAFVATAVLSEEIRNKTALTVISKPVGRPMFLIGKYLGVTAAILLAGVVLLVFFQFAIRHEVMSTTRDHLDGPVLLFGGLALALTIGVGVWGNFFYGWVFSSTAVFVLLPASLLAWLGVLLVSKDWSIQPIGTDIKPQVLLASGALLLATPVLTAVAVTASTRLGQVMTIAVCAAVFVGGLLSNHLIGRHAITNDPIAIISVVAIERDREDDFSTAGDVWLVSFEQTASAEFKPGDPFYYGPTPSGVAMIPPKLARFDGDPTSLTQVLAADASPTIVFREVDSNLRETAVVNVGGLPVSRPPQPGDYVFLTPSRVNWFAWTLWSIVPNMQFFWLVDAVTQNHPIPARYVVITTLYTGAQVIGLLSLGMILFQTREVG